MALSKVIVSGTAWTAISTAGQSGSCFEVNTCNTGGDNRVALTHGTSAPPAGTVDFIIIEPVDNPKDALIISADNSNDIYYVRCLGTTGTATIYVDVV